MLNIGRIISIIAPVFYGFAIIKILSNIIKGRLGFGIY
jgi:hypothetical protein